MYILKNPNNSFGGRYVIKKSTVSGPLNGTTGATFFTLLSFFSTLLNIYM